MADIWLDGREEDEQGGTEAEERNNGLFDLICFCSRQFAVIEGGLNGGG